MKNGCNFHALQVKSNYKIFSEKIEPKKDACRMAIKIKGKLPLKICSVLFVLYGAASLVAILLCLIDRKYVEEYDLSAYFNSSMPVLSVAGAMLVPVLLLIAGLMGHVRADRPNSMKPCFFLGLATGVIILFNVLYEIFTGNAPNMPGLFESVRFLTTAVASEMSYSGGLQRQALFSIALVLFLFIMLINAVLNRFLKHSREG